jgi:hypothetical protein
MWTAYSLKILMMLLRFLAAILSFGAFHTKPSRRFYESLRRIDNWICGSPVNLSCIASFLETHLRCWRTFSENRGISCQSFLEIRSNTLCSVSGRTANPEKGKLKNHALSCQSVLEFLRMFKKIWYETHQYFYWLSKIKGISLKLKTQKRFLFRLR